VPSVSVKSVLAKLNGGVDVGTVVYIGFGRSLKTCRRLHCIGQPLVDTVETLCWMVIAHAISPQHVVVAVVFSPLGM
jgi:hypothetical protein